MHVRKITFFIIGLGMLLFSATLPASAQVTPPSEYQLKAAFLYNFAKFIDWPPESFADEKAPFVIGILGENPFGNVIQKTVAGKEVNGHPIEVQANMTDIAKCHLLFISRSEKARILPIIKSLEGASVLTVSEVEGFTENGGMINFVEESKKIRFQINDDAAKAARLKMSSKLLSLALPSSR